MKFMFILSSVFLCLIILRYVWVQKGLMFLWLKGLLTMLLAVFSNIFHYHMNFFDLTMTVVSMIFLLSILFMYMIFIKSFLEHQIFCMWYYKGYNSLSECLLKEYLPLVSKFLDKIIILLMLFMMVLFYVILWVLGPPFAIKAIWLIIYYMSINVECLSLLESDFMLCFSKHLLMNFNNFEIFLI